jgi:hypothetical protein
MTSERWTALAKVKTLDLEDGDQVTLIASTGGSKSTLVATLLLDAPSLVAIDTKGSLTYPNTKLLELPPIDSPKFAAAMEALRTTPRIIVRPHALEVENLDTYERIFEAIYNRGPTQVWVDEVGAIAKTSTVYPKWLGACSNRGRTRKITLLTCSQAAYGQMPMALRRNANLAIFGVMIPTDVQQLPYDGIDAILDIRPKTGRFVLYRTGDQRPYALYIPVPKQLAKWQAP